MPPQTPQNSPARLRPAAPLRKRRMVLPFILAALLTASISYGLIRLEERPSNKIQNNVASLINNSRRTEGQSVTRPGKADAERSTGGTSIRRALPVRALEEAISPEPQIPFIEMFVALELLQMQLEYMRAERLRLSSILADTAPDIADPVPAID